MTAGDAKFQVTELKHKDDAILHIGKYVGEAKFEVGQQVDQEIDGEFRRLNARIHSAGHLLDMAMNRCGRTELKPGKGYHFKEGPYVEYIGNVDNKETEKLIEDLNKHSNDIINEAKADGQQVFRKMCSYEEANDELKGAGGVPPYIAEGRELRVLKLTKEDLGCPCGGTHVHAVPEIGGIKITRIKKNKKNTKVSYHVLDPQ